MITFADQGKDKLESYKAITANDVEGLNQKAAEVISQGYLPYGGISVCSCWTVDSGYTEVIFAQAFVRKYGF